jgi:hypothetical protein
VVLVAIGERHLRRALGNLETHQIAPVVEFMARRLR